MRHEKGSGSVLGLALIGATVGLVSIAVPLYMALVASQSVQGAADASALAAADVAVGIAPGSPCAVATRVAAANAAAIAACEVDGEDTTVRVERVVLGIPIASSATAGISPAVSN